MTIRPLYPAVEPTLNLDFANTKRLDPRISFSRASTGTYFGEDGLIKSAAVNEARFDHNPINGESLGLLVEEARTNRTVRSQGLGLSTGNWFTYKANCIDNAGLAPDGTFTAARLVPNTENLIHYVADGTGASLSGTATVSVFAKADGYNFVYLAFDYASGDGLFPGSAYFDLSTGQIALGASTTGSIQQLPNGWYRCTITATAGSTVQANPFVVAANSLSNFNFAGNGTSGILLWGFQFESGSFPTSYIPTPATFTGRTTTATFYDSAGVVQTAASGVARSNAFFPDSNGVMRPAGLLLETAGTNLVTYSEQFDNAAWSKTNTTITADALAAPTGSVIADLLLETSSTGAHAVTQSITTAASRYTVSFFVRNNGRDRLAIAGSASLGGNLGNGIVFDLSTNSYISGASSGSSASVQLLPSSWRRISYSWDANATTGIIGIYLIDSGTNTSYTGDTSKGIYIWGAQLEASPYPTSYIPTTASTVTRAADTSTSATVTRSADVAQITGTNFSSWYNQSAGTLLATAIIPPNSTNTVNYPYLARIGTSSSLNNNISFVVQNNNGQELSYIQNTAMGHGNIQGGSGFKNAISYNQSAATGSSSLNGSIATASSTSQLTTYDVFNIGSNNSDGRYFWNSTISRIVYWPIRLSDAILQSVTL